MIEDTNDTMKGHNPIPIASTKLLLKKERVITAKLQNMKVSLKIIAENEGASYSYTRKVWAKYLKSLVTNKDQPIPPLDSPFPFQVHNQGMFGEGSTRWYRDCPVEASKTNRNAQKTYGTPHYSITFHKGGKYQIYIYTVDWADELKKWLSSWMDPEDSQVFFDYLIDAGGKHYCVSTPGVPLGFKIKIPGIGKFETDKTPFPKGTSEFIVDPGFPRMLKSINRSIKVLSDNQVIVSRNMEKFGVGMEQHMALIKTLQDVSATQVNTTKQFGEAIKELVKVIKELKN